MIDGEEGFRTGLAGNLRDDGHRVLDYSSPTHIDGDRIGALVAAVQYGRDDCLRLVREFRLLRPRAPILILTTCWSALLDAVADLGSVLSKPADYETIHRLIHSAQGRRD